MMEEAPKIERVVASQGISISDTAKILSSYLSKVNHHHHQSINFNETSKDDNTNLDNDEDANNKSPIRKSKQEREEDALIAQMDQLANSKSSGMISDDIYERLKQITQSITAEVEGRTISACGLDKNKDSDDNVNTTTDDGVNDFQAGQSEKHTKQQQEVQVKQQQADTTPKSHREKKKAKKDKKAAKRAKKEATRKAKEMEEDETITTDIPLHRKKKIY